MNLSTQEPITDYRKILGNVGDEVAVLAEVAQALYVFSKGFEGAEEEAGGLRFLAVEINGQVRAIEAQIGKAEQTLAVRAVD